MSRDGLECPSEPVQYTAPHTQKEREVKRNTHTHIERKAMYRVGPKPKLIFILNSTQHFKGKQSTKQPFQGGTHIHTTLSTEMRVRKL